MSDKLRLDKALVERQLVESRSQAENVIRLGFVKIDGRQATKPGQIVDINQHIAVEGEQYVSRAALKLASIAQQFKLDFRGATVLDVGSSTGGFTDYALQHGAKKVIAVDVGTDQMHPRLRMDLRVELHEKTDIRDVCLEQTGIRNKEYGKKGITHVPYRIFLTAAPNIIVVDVSFISLTKILGHLATLMNSNSVLVAMCKPQFEAGKDQINKGIIKNNAVRRQILKDFEAWLMQNDFLILDKADSRVPGTKGNIERFYKLRTRS